jgi:hypothetical protein
MGRSSSRRIAFVVAVLAISSCSSSDDAGDSDASTGSAPVDSVRPNAANGTPATFGDPASLGDLKVTASDPVFGTDDSGPWLTVTLRAENRTNIDVSSPQFELRCSGSTRGGSWIPPATFTPGEKVPPLSFNEGTLSLTLPGDDREGAPRPECATPATVVATLLVYDNAGASAPVQKRIAWPVPDELVNQLNAAPQPT